MAVNQWVSGTVKSHPEFGLGMAFTGMIISCAGVLANNILLDHILAMIIWVPSNTLFLIYFFGRTQGMWDGHIGDNLMCVNYLVMLVSGLWGLIQSGVIVI